MAEVIKDTDDERVENSPLRHRYRKLSEDEKLQIDELKSAGEAFLQLCEGFGSSREISIARTKIEEAVMWSVKHVTAGTAQAANGSGIRVAAPKSPPPPKPRR